MLSNLPYHVRFWITLALTVALSALINHLLKKRFPNWYQHKITPLTFLAVLLLLWGGHDFWNYVTVARQVAEHYDTPLLYYAAQREVTSGVVKVLLAGAALLAAWFRRPGRKPLRVRTALTLLTLAAVLGTWAVGMFCLTSVTAEYAAKRYLDSYGDFADTLNVRNLSHWWGKGLDAQHENYENNLFWSAMADANEAQSFSTFHTTATENEGNFLPRQEAKEVFSAAAVFDAQGNLLWRSWEDFFFFEYLTEADWLAGAERSHQKARCLFDRSHLTEAGQEILQDGSLTLDAAALRFTGTFDGVTFTPRTIEYVAYNDFRDALFARGSVSYTVAQVVEEAGLAWQLLYKDPEAALPGEAITLYTDWFDVCWRQDNVVFDYDQNTYYGFTSLLRNLGPELAAGQQVLARYEGLDLVLPSVSYCTSVDGETYFDSYYYGTEAYEGEAPELHYYIVSVVVCSPWVTALRELWPIYLVTLLLAAALAWAVRQMMIWRLVDPLELTAEDLAQSLPEGEKWQKDRGLWREAEAVRAGQEAQRDLLQMRANEITRLNTALTYARTAEENRRQMTSHIAHELKTPLAVVHSYAEGLKEHIAEDKRDKYIDVILSETERMDAMVLEMLDLSRLEAGKVKLARDQFSLEEVARSVFERLEMALKAKELHLTYDFPESSMVTADEGRIGQVVENFATNAVKYTSPGGNITVSITRDHRGTTFTVANDCPPLSQEVLDKVWDTFYRVDEARSGGGTGLGLAIAKRIIDLHGGKCAAENTKTGVAFHFTL